MTIAITIKLTITRFPLRRSFAGKGSHELENPILLRTVNVHASGVSNPATRQAPPAMHSVPIARVLNVALVKLVK
jgi:hypothetical protein